MQPSIRGLTKRATRTPSRPDSTPTQVDGVSFPFPSNRHHESQSPAVSRHHVQKRRELVSKDKSVFVVR